MARNFDAAFVRRWAAMAVELLRLHRMELNALNVFPVPDGDTGTNLYLTFQSAASAELRRTGSVDDLADAWSALARGALLGARGNSGVMLASVLTAIADEVLSNPQASLKELMQTAAQAARRSVHRPVEGTALSVLDAAAISEFARPDAIAQAARIALANTPEQLPALKAAGVVDAGGRGVVLLLDALSAAWAGYEMNSPAVGFVPLDVPTALECDADAKFELMFLVPAEKLSRVLNIIGEQGSSLVVTEGIAEAQIHIHLDTPAKLLHEIEAVSPTSEIQIELLDQAPASRRVIVQIYGNELAEILSSDYVRALPAEPNQHPSVQDFVAAGLKANCSELVLLPSDLDTILVAELAIEELRTHGVQAVMVPSTTVVESLAAIAVFDTTIGLTECVEQMQNARAQVVSFGLAVADRQAHTSVGQVSVGDWLLTQNGQLVGAGEDFLTLLEASQFQSAELITVLIGTDFGSADVERLRNFLNTSAPSAEVVEIVSGQKVWPLLLGVE